MTKAKTGRPLRYRSASELERKILAYFDKQDELKKPYTITGLARTLGMTRKMLIEYQARDLFRNVIEAAKTRIEESVEEILLSGKAQAGAVFWLKNKGWSDRQEITVEDVTKLSKDQLIGKIKSLSNVAPIKKVAQSADKRASN